ncbi:hypothetical protein GCM10010967_01120 [Dyadobacter beijingensis]|uniref:Uncharacterized protein n=1 Tax=Dyadobacter beijingensis TaxID=365489 RepID=A0ABQ2HC71_9BACT|nr:hypothetical protein GCM10010967_01120 [Dyadobacter beijingensis]
MPDIPVDGKKDECKYDKKEGSIHFKMIVVISTTNTDQQFHVQYVNGLLMNVQQWINGCAEG